MENEDLKSTVSIREVLDSLKENVYPVIAVFGSDVLENPQACLCINGKCIVDLATYNEQAVPFFIYFYIFNFQYQARIEATLEFIQRCILNIEPIEAGHKRGGKRRRADVHPLVLQLANRLNSQQSMWGISGDDDYNLYANLYTFLRDLVDNMNSLLFSLQAQYLVNGNVKLYHIFYKSI